MASPNTPLPPAPVRTNNTVLAVVIGIVAVFAIIIGSGIFVVGSVLHGTRIVRSGYGQHQQVEIHSPLGNVNVNGQGDTAKVDIDSPFGSLHVDPNPDLSRLDMPVYPGATLVTSTLNSPFHRDADGLAPLNDLDGLKGVHLRDGNAPNVQVELRGENGQMFITVAEFRTTATPSEVEQYYRQQLARYGDVTSHIEDDAQRLEVKTSDDNRRVAAIRQGPSATHFILVRIVGGQLEK